jgi:hypothetical protein
MSDQDYRAALADCAKAFAEAERIRAQADAAKVPKKTSQSYSLASRIYEHTSAIIRAARTRANGYDRS